MDHDCRHVCAGCRDVAIGLYLLLLVLPRVDPGRANYAQFSKAYNIIRLSVLALLFGIYFVIIASVHGRNPNVSILILPLTGALFIVLGALMHGIRPNWFVGVRTPWTLLSERSWVKTHQLTGWLFAALGILMIMFGFVGAPFAGVLFIGVVGMAVVLFLYSYLVWRDDPDKIPPPGTLPHSHA